LAAARERAGVRVIPIVRYSGEFDHRMLATPTYRVRRITLTLTLSRSTGRGNETRAFDYTAAARLSA